MSHRWSGWPGAWCLDCGCGDPLEEAMCDGAIVWDADGENFHVPDDKRANYAGFQPCPEPGSKRHDPYAARAAQLTGD